MNDPQSMPYRESYQNFSRYVLHIAKALEASPQAYAFTPIRLSPSTVQSQCKDAITFGLKYEYAHDDLPFDKFRRLAPSFQVASLGRLIIIGAASAVKAYKSRREAIGIDADDRPEHEFIMVNTNDNLVELAMFLGIKGRFNPPVRVFVKGLNDRAIKSLEGQGDVVFQPSDSDPNKYYIL